MKGSAELESTHIHCLLIDSQKSETLTFKYNYRGKDLIIIGSINDHIIKVTYRSNQ